MEKKLASCQCSSHPDGAGLESCPKLTPRLDHWLATTPANQGQVPGPSVELQEPGKRHDKGQDLQAITFQQPTKTAGQHTFL